MWDKQDKEMEYLRQEGRFTDLSVTQEQDGHFWAIDRVHLTFSVQ